MPDISYSLEIGGNPAPPSLLAAIQQIDIEDNATMADMIRLRVALGVSAEGSKWNVLDEDMFPRLTNLKIGVTIGSADAIPLISGYVIETRAEMSSVPGQSVLAVMGMDPTVLMHLEEKVKSWPNMADSDVANAIFSDSAYGFTPVVDTTKWKRNQDDQTLIQRGSDIKFLQQLAEHNGFECFVELNDSSGDVEGHFHAPKHEQSPQGVLTVNMGPATNVNAFSARFDMLSATTAKVTGLDVESGSDQPADITSAEQAGLGSTKSTETDHPRKVLLSGTGMAQTGELQVLAQAVVDRSAWAIVAEGELNTVAYGGVLRAKRPVSVRGAGRQFSGTYYVEKVLHSFTADGYKQRFTLKRNALGLTGSEKFSDDGGLPS
jgi:phage protein D